MNNKVGPGAIIAVVVVVVLVLGVVAYKVFSPPSEAVKSPVNPMNDPQYQQMHGGTGAGAGNNPMNDPQYQRMHNGPGGSGPH